MIVLGRSGLPGPVGPFDFKEDRWGVSGTPITPGQTSFTLSKPPIDPESVRVFVNGKEEVDTSIVGAIVTLTNLGYTLDSIDDVRISYVA